VKGWRLLLGAIVLVTLSAATAGGEPGLRAGMGAPVETPGVLNAVGRFLARHGGMVQRRDYKIGSIDAREPLWYAPVMDATRDQDADLVISAVVLTAATPEGQEKVFGVCVRKPETRKKLGGIRYLDIDECEALVEALPLLQRQAEGSAVSKTDAGSLCFSTKSRLKFTIVQAGERKVAAVNCGDNTMQRVVLIRTDDLPRVSQMLQKALGRLREMGASQG
jgi:hypothetical protein